MSPSNGAVNGEGSGRTGLNHIEHPVSKFDTLAGVAIKYGVEVADIKRMNGLATDLQMFALKTLLIPSPGRHPPSSTLSDGPANSRGNRTGKTSQHLHQSTALDSFQSLRLKPPKQKVSPAMNTLQKFYGLKSSNLKSMAEGTEMAVYRNGSLDHSDDEWLPAASPISDFASNHYHNSRTSTNGFLNENGAAVEHIPFSEIGEGEGDNSVRRRQKSEVDSGAGSPEKLLKENTSSGSSGFSTSTGKGLAMRPKAASKTMLLADSDFGCLDSGAGRADSSMTDGLNGVRKSSSASSLRDQDRSNSATIWTPPKWSLKPDLQALSTSAITKPIFDGLPIPITGRRTKAALD